jgi:hypothetical protein
LDQVVSRDIREYKEMLVANYTNIEFNKNKTLLAGLPAYSLVYSGKEGPYYFKAMDLWALRGDKVYNLSYIAPMARYDANLPLIDKMVNSFKVIG